LIRTIAKRFLPRMPMGWAGGVSADLPAGMLTCIQLLFLHVVHVPLAANQVKG
jgi:hypothetical protein